MVQLRLCQCPTVGFFHFYDGINNNILAYANCVNALNRASSISTLFVAVGAAVVQDVSMP